MKKRWLSIYLLLVVATAVVMWAIQRRSQGRLREEIDILRGQTDYLFQLKAANEGLSNALAQSGGPAISTDDLRELLRLRSEAGRLREENRVVSKAQAEPRNSGDDSLPSVPPGQESHLRESWAYVGRATPEAALESIYWAMSRGDLKSVQAGYTPEAWKNLEAEKADDQKSSEGPPNDMAEELIEAFKKAKGFHILKTEPLSHSKVNLEVVLEGMGGAASMSFTNVGGEWLAEEDGNN